MLGLFRKYFTVFAVVIIISIVSGFFLSRIIMQSFGSPRPPPIFLARTIEAIDPNDRVRAFERMSEWEAPDRRGRAVLLDENGAVLYPPNEELDIDWTSIVKPMGPFAFTRLNDESDGPFQSLLVRFPGEPAQYLYMKGKPPEGPGLPIMIFGTALFCSLVGIAIALSFIFRSMKKNVMVADKVISDLQSGNLKARLPVSGSDDISQSMMRFNQMAEEIENLVGRLHATEEARSRLLQELTHDLKTPVASLKNMLETLSRGGDTLAPEVRGELLALSFREVDYFARLVDDLLLLAQVSEPRYKTEKMLVNVTEILSEEADDASARKGHSSSIVLSTSFHDLNQQMVGDPHLLKRLFRNVLDNAFSFARTAVTVRADIVDKKLVIQIIDDGPGFSKETLESYGKRRTTRFEKKEVNGRISIGLGSVIMLTIADLHRGKMIATNTPDGHGKVVIELPI